MDTIFTPHRVCASGVKQLVLSVVRPSVVCHKKIFLTGNLESTMTSKWENNDDIRRILAYVYLVEHETVSFSAFSFFLIISVVHHFIYYGNGHAYSLLGRNIRIRIRGGNARYVIRRTVSQRLRVKVQPCNRGKATASHQPVTSVSLAIQPSACLYR